MKKRRRELAISCVSSYACRFCGTPAGDFYIAVSGQKFLRIVKGLFSKSPLTGVWGGAPPVNGVRGGAPYNTCLCGVLGGAPYNTCRCGARGSAPYISRGARDRASHIPTGVRGGAPFVVGVRGSAPFSSCDPGQSPVYSRADSAHNAKMQQKNQKNFDFGIDKATLPC